MELKRQDKVALVTGASKGIGAGTDRAFGKAGATVIVNDASGAKDVDEVVGEIALADVRGVGY